MVEKIPMCHRCHLRYVTSVVPLAIHLNHLIHITELMASCTFAQLFIHIMLYIHDFLLTFLQIDC